MELLLTLQKSSTYQHKPEIKTLMTNTEVAENCFQAHIQFDLQNIPDHK
jgi:hypothetical protein